jgi:hypothetical protein
MPDHIMMKCGHAANSIQTMPDGTKKPSCAICWPDPESEIIDENPPSLEDRVARCAYYGTLPNGRNHESNYDCKRGERCLCERPSSPDLPFFYHRPEREFDEFYCGCWGWD